MMKRCGLPSPRHLAIETPADVATVNRAPACGGRLSAVIGDNMQIQVCIIADQTKNTTAASGHVNTPVISSATNERPLLKPFNSL